MIHLVCVGACYLDTILRYGPLAHTYIIWHTYPPSTGMYVYTAKLTPGSIPHFPAEDAKLRASKLQVRRGGNCPNSLEILQQLLARYRGPVHVKPYLISTLPAANAPGTQRIRDSFGPLSMVDFTRCIYRDGLSDPASSYILRSEASGSRTLVNYNELPEMTAQEFSAAIDGVRGDMWVHFEVGRPRATPPDSPPSMPCIQWLEVHNVNTQDTGTGANSGDDAALHPTPPTQNAERQGQRRGREARPRGPGRAGG